MFDSRKKIRKEVIETIIKEEPRTLKRLLNIRLK
jgi:hypothetical protein